MEGACLGHGRQTGAYDSLLSLEGRQRTQQTGVRGQGRWPPIFLIMSSLSGTNSQQYMLCAESMLSWRSIWLAGCLHGMASLAGLPNCCCRCRCRPLLDIDIVHRSGTFFPLIALLFRENHPIVAFIIKRRLAAIGRMVPNFWRWVRVRSSCSCSLQMLLS